MTEKQKQGFFSKFFGAEDDTGTPDVLRASSAAARQRGLEAHLAELAAVRDRRVREAELAAAAARDACEHASVDAAAEVESARVSLAGAIVAAWYAVIDPLVRQWTVQPTREIARAIMDAVVLADNRAREQLGVELRRELIAHAFVDVALERTPALANRVGTDFAWNTYAERNLRTLSTKCARALGAPVDFARSLEEIEAFIEEEARRAVGEPEQIARERYALMRVQATARDERREVTAFNDNQRLLENERLAEELRANPPKNLRIIPQTF